MKKSNPNKTTFTFDGIVKSRTGGSRPQYFIGDNNLIDINRIIQNRCGLLMNVTIEVENELSAKETVHIDVEDQQFQFKPNPDSFKMLNENVYRLEDMRTVNEELIQLGLVRFNQKYCVGTFELKHFNGIKDPVVSSITILKEIVEPMLTIYHIDELNVDVLCISSDK